MSSPSLRDLTLAFFKIGCLSFGGAAAQIALMHRLIVDDKTWLSETQYLHALNYCMILPGPEAQQLATYVGWLLRGVWGGVIAGLLFILPGALIMLGLSVLYVLGTGVPVIDGVFFGIKAAVLAIVVEAILRLAKRALKTPFLITLAGVSFALIFFLKLPFPFLLLLAAACGALALWVFPKAIGDVSVKDQETDKIAPQKRRSAFIGAIGSLALWWLPFLVLLMFSMPQLFQELFLFFSKLAVLSFGGAYALLGWLTQDAVARGWVSTTQMVAGLGLAETTPGPTILVVQFVAFLAAFKAAAPLDPILAASLASLLAVWATFAPSFFFIFLGAPYVETLRHNRIVAAVLRTMTAAVVGVVVSLSLWFAVHVLFTDVQPVMIGVFHGFSIGGINGLACGFALIAFAMLFALHRSVIETIGLLAGLGAISVFI